jgi:glycosyltransferase involved in cell wall biosynthesis
MKYSVVIPLYNKASHIKRAIDSVLRQSVPDFELIVVDDGSTDSGGEEVRRHTDPRIRLIAQTNGGVSAARNRGARESVCDLVAFLDADDAWEPRFLETVGSLSSRFPEAAVWGTGYTIVNRIGAEERPTYHGNLPTDGGGALIDYFSGPHVAGRHGDSPLLASTLLLRKSALLEAGGFPLGVTRGEDTDTWIRLALRYPIAWTPDVQATIYEDAENRSVAYLYLGDYPFLESVRSYEREHASQHLNSEVFQYLAWRHTGLLRMKWLTGERELLREIVGQFRHTEGYAWKCRKWYLLSWIPRPLVKLAWKARQRVAGRPAQFPQPREIQSLALMD